MSENEHYTDGTERLRPQCFNPNCDKSFESVDEMVAVPGRGGRSPRHFCESCAERIRRGPPMTDGGSTNGTERCEDCGVSLGPGAYWSRCGPCASLAKREQLGQGGGGDADV